MPTSEIQTKIDLLKKAIAAEAGTGPDDQAKVALANTALDLLALDLLAGLLIDIHDIAVSVGK